MRDEDTDKDPSIVPFVLFVTVILIVCVIFGVVVFRCIDTWEHRGLFGDMFGALNALFSGAAFAGVVYAIILQRRELAMQREEMRLSREELAAQNQLITAQLATMQDSLHFERTKEDLSSEPFFRLGSGTGGANRRTVELFNLGGRITGISARVLVPAAGISVSLQPSDVWDTNNRAELAIVGFGGNPCPNCEFELAYSDKLGRPHTKRYRIPGDAHNLEQLPNRA